jgi:hypothetical protein
LAKKTIYKWSLAIYLWLFEPQSLANFSSFLPFFCPPSFSGIYSLVRTSVLWYCREHFTRHALDLEKSLSNFRVMGRVDPKYGLFDILGHIQNEDARKFWKESISSEVS